MPKHLRDLAWHHQRTLYGLLVECAWHTLDTFCHNDRQLQGRAGAVAVLHTHSRRLDYHPHVHLAMPAGALDTCKRLWRVKRSLTKGTHYLFNHTALAKVFRAKLLQAIAGAGLVLPCAVPEQWVVDCMWPPTRTCRNLAGLKLLTGLEALGPWAIGVRSRI